MTTISEDRAISDVFDSPWKEILDAYFKDFVEFFLPQAFKEIDWRRGYEFLDTELVRITREAKIGNRHMDRLAKVWLKNGLERCILIHVDIQGERQKNFPDRMFIYYYRSYDLKQWPVVGVAILADTNKKWRPREFRQELWGCQVVYRFNVVKLLDFSEDIAILEQSDNPFAIVTLAHLQAKKTKKRPGERYQAKWHIIRSLYQRGFSRQKIIDLFRFVDWVLALPPEEDRQFWQDLSHLEEVQQMPYLSSIERIGMEKGIEKGMEKGMEKGTLKGHADMLLALIKNRFGQPPEWISTKLAQADMETLVQWGNKLFGAKKVEEIFQ
ncbi:MAG: hypothetical protein G8345_04280 [Magnetococcales bacterium]|nr:hypothetical protein [Magnetococcales bacterium]NGZ26088.1 hypothetical protein [Magnetococcales bacterium]